MEQIKRFSNQGTSGNVLDVIDDANRWLTEHPDVKIKDRQVLNSNGRDPFMILIWYEEQKPKKK